MRLSQRWSQTIQIGFWVVLVLVFIMVRWHGMDNAFVWFDDYATAGMTQPIPWDTFMPATLNHFAVVTGPALPSLISRGIVNLAGADPLLLRLPAFAASIAALGLYALILRRLFDSALVRSLVLVLLTFSIPNILYGQSIQPSLFFELATCLQVYVFVVIVCRPRERATWEQLARHVQVFHVVALIAFLLNYLSILVYLPLVTIIFVFVMRANPVMPLRERFAILLEMIGGTLAVALLTILRLSAPGDNAVARPYFEAVYYPQGILDALRLWYDFFTYHFNFVYDPTLYMPLKLNLLSLPYILLSLVGVGYFCTRSRWHAGVVIVLVAVFTAAGIFGLFPLGGTRHSLTIAPFAFIALGYGAQAILHRLQADPALLRSARTMLIGLGAAALVMFAFSGSTLYEARRSRIDLARLVELSAQYGTNTIAGYYDAMNIIDMWNYRDGKILDQNNLRLLYYQQGAFQSDTPYLLVMYHHAIDLDPSWRGTQLVSSIDASTLGGAKITPLVEDFGAFPPIDTPQQSIYFPLNGFFVYLIDPQGI